MSPTTYAGWLADGSPWHAARPIADFVNRMHAHGFTYGVIGAVGTHLNIPNPEDHAPYSHTPWPGPQPYPAVLACDIMPGGAVDWRDLMGRVVADKNSGVHGTEWIKYLNWTDRAGNCWHESWQPGHVRVASNDRGHGHISGRTDYVNSSIVTDSGWDPVARLLGGDDMTIDYNQGAPPGALTGNPGRTVGQMFGDMWGQTFGVPDKIAALQAELDAVKAELDAIKVLVSVPPSVTMTQADRDAIAAALAGLVPTLQQVEDAAFRGANRAEDS